MELPGAIQSKLSKEKHAMSESQDSFDALLSKAPEATNAHALVVIGFLARTEQKDEFAIVIPGGRTWVFKRAAYKRHRVLSESALGPAAVEIELDPHNVPEDLRKAIANAGESAGQISTIAEVSLSGPLLPNKSAWWDIGPAFGNLGFTPPSPFVLANPHAAPMSLALTRPHKYYKVRKDPQSDLLPKHPSLEHSDLL
jgi:hypothetical protein